MAAIVLQFSHFGSMVAFALLVSIALGCFAQRTAQGRVRYAAWSFVLFVGVALAIAWLMYPFSK